jgi:hypothetical protein
MTVTGGVPLSYPGLGTSRPQSSPMGIYNGVLICMIMNINDLNFFETEMVPVDVIQCCNLAVSLPILTNFSTRVVLEVAGDNFEKRDGTTTRKLKILFTNQFSPMFYISKRRDSLNRH